MPLRLSPMMIPQGLYSVVDNFVLLAVPLFLLIIFVIMIECALITPPVGLNLFVIQAVGKAKMDDVIKGVWPFTLIMLLSVFIIYWFPKIALYIPYNF